MALVAEVDSKFVGMFFRLRRVLQGTVGGGFRHVGSSGGAAAAKSKRIESRA